MPIRHLLAATLPLAFAAAPIAANAQAAGGDQLFKQKCQMCHAITPDGKAGPMAPNLRGVVGRKAAGTGFASYSTALKGSGIVWSRDKLDAFLTAPAKLVPGTRMVIAVPDKGQRAAIVAWLAAQK